MAYIPTRFAGPTAMTTVPKILTTFVTQAIIKELTVTNNSNGVLYFSLAVVPSGQEYGLDSQKIYNAIPILGNQTINLSHSMVFNSGDKIYGFGSIPNLINIVVSGVSVTAN
jgi:phosphodiesterase/alkaline phosphatase D-like protein